MTHEEILESVIQLLQSNKCNYENVNGETRIEELAGDSLVLTSFLLDLEERFGIVATDEIWLKWNKIGDLINYIAGFLEEYSSINLSETKESP
ncbi:MAG TPA: phosphopantetheine-binding protein [archaeon]|nr:phosphopantetheine-binding protein [archaeon]